MSDDNTQFPIVSEGQIGEATIQTVNARDLHAFLEVGKDFTTWIKDRIDQYAFAPDIDFTTYEDLRSPISGSSKARAQKVTEYAISIDMGKELAMVERNEQGKKARRYFIECERRAKDPMHALNDPAAMRGILLTYAEKVLALEGQMAEAMPKLQALERIADADGSFCATDAAKTLQRRPKDIFGHLRGPAKWFYSRGGHDVGYQDKIQAGLLIHKTTVILKPDGTEKVVTQVRITPKGLTVLAQQIGAH